MRKHIAESANEELLDWNRNIRNAVGDAKKAMQEKDRKKTEEAYRELAGLIVYEDNEFSHTQTAEVEYIVGRVREELSQYGTIEEKMKKSKMIIFRAFEEYKKRQERESDSEERE